MKRQICLIYMIILCMFCVFGQVEFLNPVINKSSGLLFSVAASSVSGDEYNCLYKAILSSSLPKSTNQTNISLVTEAISNTPSLLTWYPEKIETLEGGKYLQIRNRCGSALYNAVKDICTWQYQPTLTGDIDPFSQDSIPSVVSVSPDGNWMCSFKRKSSAHADILLTDVKKHTSVVIVESAEYRYNIMPVLWAPDSSSVIYENKGNLYFIDPENAFSSSQLEEKFRKIGVGTIKNIAWISSKHLMYINRDMVYMISDNELYTRALYSGMMGSGKVIGRLPFLFDGTRDMFSPNRDSSGIILIQNSKILWYMEFAKANQNFANTLFTYPFININGEAVDVKVFWPSEDRVLQIPIIWMEMLVAGKTQCYAYRLVKSKTTSEITFETLALPDGVSSPILSPDSRSIAFVNENALYIYNIDSWEKKFVFKEEKVISFSWINKVALYIGGKETIRYWEPVNGINKVLLLSSSGNRYGWMDDGNTVVVENNVGSFVYNNDKRSWIESKFQLQEKLSAKNEYWRVFLGDTINSKFSNAIYVRSLTGLTQTRPLVKEFSQKKKCKPCVSLVVDAMDNTDGLTKILYTLSKFNIKTTFFINGEFMSRYPSSLEEIINNGHQCGSLFFTPADFTTTEFIVDEIYIRRGLARNEDQFYTLTGKELTLVWHAPFYKANNEIIKAGERAGYSYANTTVVPLDVITLEEGAKNSAVYFTPSAIIENYIPMLRDKSVIPVSTGISNGTRSSYLYDTLDVLIKAIYDAGFDIVPLSTIIPPVQVGQ